MLFNALLGSIIFTYRKTATIKCQLSEQTEFSPYYAVQLVLLGGGGGVSHTETFYTIEILFVDNIKIARKTVND